MRTNMRLGEKIVKIRKDNKLTQEDFAEKYNVTRQTISNWENGKSCPDLDTLVKISEDFAISLDVLLKEDKKVVENIAKSQKNSKKYKRLLIITGIAAGIFLIVNLIWFIGVKSRYLELTKNFDSELNYFGNYVEDVNGYRYTVKDTGYLGNSGFANVSTAQDLEVFIDENGSESTNGFTKVTLYIWPEMFSGYTYGIDIDNWEEVYQIYVDKNGNYISNENVEDEEAEKRKALLEEYREEINKLFELADKMWDIR